MRKLIFLFLTLITISSCYKDVDNSTREEFVRPPKIVVDGSIFGTYSVASQLPLQDVSIVVNDVEFDLLNGEIPKLDLNNINKKGQFIELFNNDDRVGAAQIALYENEINYIDLKLTEPFRRGEFYEGVQYDLLNGINLSAEGEGFIQVNGVRYTGDPQVEYFSSDDSDYIDQLISFAIAQNGEEVVVEVEKAFFIGFRDEDNNDLLIVEGKINIDIEAEKEVLFYFDPIDGTWQWVSELSAGANEEIITRSGWFAVGSYTSGKLLEGSIKLDDLGVSGQRLRIGNHEHSNDLFTTGNGSFLSYVPENSSLDLQLIDNKANVYYTKAINPSGKDKIEIALPSVSTSVPYILSDFQVFTCDGTLNEDKSISFYYASGESVRYVLPSNDLTWLPIAENDFMIQSGDGPMIQWNREFKDIHYLSDCASFSDGFTLLKIRDDQKIYSAFDEVRISQSSTLKSEDESLKLILETSAAGNLAADKVNIAINDLDFGQNGYFISCEVAESGCGIDVCEISHFKVGGDDWNRIFFKGKLWMQTIEPAQAGNFDVEGYILSKK